MRIFTSHFWTFFLDFYNYFTLKINENKSCRHVRLLQLWSCMLIIVYALRSCFYTETTLLFYKEFAMRFSAQIFLTVVVLFQNSSVESIHYYEISFSAVPLEMIVVYAHNILWILGFYAEIEDLRISFIYIYSIFLDFFNWFYCFFFLLENTKYF